MGLKGKSRGKVLIWWKRLFWSNQWNGTNENSFAPQNEQPTAKLNFSVVLKNFPGNSQKCSLYGQSITILESS